MLLTFQRLNQGFTYPSNIIDLSYWPTGTTPVVPIKSPFASFILMWNNIFDFNSSDNINFVVNQVGGRGFTPSTGPLIFVYSGTSNTVGTVQAYNDGIINVTTFNVNNPYPVLEACRRILKQTGATGQPYKLAVETNGKTEYTVRSVYWGSQMNMSDTETNVQLVDKQGINTL